MAAPVVIGMTSTPATPALPGLLRWLLLALALVAVALAGLRLRLGPEAALERMARRSPPLSEALADGRPTLVEFYADWCESCLAMAPAMEDLERRHPELDVVLLNVDNPVWEPQLLQWQVNGIPHLELFGADGQDRGQAIGRRQPQELEQLAVALQSGGSLPDLAGVGSQSPLADGPAATATATATATAGPRSHG